MRAIRAAYAFDGKQFLQGGATVLVDEGRIVDVIRGAGNVPSDVPVSEYDGTLLPGLIDCHTHLVADCTMGGLERAGEMTDAELDQVITASLRTHAEAGVTTVRDLGDVRYRTLDFRSTPGLPRVVASGPPITTSQGHCHFLGGAVAGTSEDQLRAAVRERVKHGVDVVKVMGSGGFATPDSDQLGAQFTAEQLGVLLDAAHEAELDLIVHAHSLLAMEYAVAAGVDGIEHFSGLSPTHGSHVPDEFLRKVASRGITVDLTMGNDRDMLSMMPEPPPALAALMARFGVTDFATFYAARIAELERFRRYGVELVAGVDSGMGPAKRHGAVWRVVVEMVEGGYGAAEALAAATSGAARACGLGEVTGRLAPGYAADVLVADGDLARDVSGAGRLRFVLVRGTAVDPRPTGVRAAAPGG